METVLYSLTTIAVEVDGLQFHVCAAVSDTLPVSFLLGNDIRELGKLLQTPLLQSTTAEQVDQLAAAMEDGTPDTPLTKAVTVTVSRSDKEPVTQQTESFVATHDCRQGGQ